MRLEHNSPTSPSFVVTEEDFLRGVMLYARRASGFRRASYATFSFALMASPGAGEGGQGAG